MLINESNIVQKRIGYSLKQESKRNKERKGEKNYTYKNKNSTVAFKKKATIRKKNCNKLHK